MKYCVRFLITFLFTIFFAWFVGAFETIEGVVGALAVEVLMGVLNFIAFDLIESFERDG